MNDPLRFAKYDRAIDAITAYLIERGEAVTQEEIVNGVINGGYRLDKATVKLDLNRSIQAYLHGSRANRSRLRQAGGLISLAEWPEQEKESH